MRITYIYSLLLLTNVMLFSNRTQAQSGNTTKQPAHRIVMQLTSSDEKVHKGLIKQLNNLKSGWGDSVAIEVVCHGPGIEFLTTDKTKFSEEIYKLKQQNIVFIVCENSLREREVAKEAILPQMQFVKMGIAEIVVKQEKGWSYIKAGF